MPAAQDWIAPATFIGGGLGEPVVFVGDVHEGRRHAEEHPAADLAGGDGLLQHDPRGVAHVDSAEEDRGLVLEGKLVLLRSDADAAVDGKRGETVEVIFGRVLHADDAGLEAVGDAGAATAGVLRGRDGV